MSGKTRLQMLQKEKRCVVLYPVKQNSKYLQGISVARTPSSPSLRQTQVRCSGSDTDTAFPPHTPAGQLKFRLLNQIIKYKVMSIKSNDKL